MASKFGDGIKAFSYGRQVTGPRFFVHPDLFEVPLGGLVGLPHATSRHATRVLRLPTGAEIRLFDGTGGEYWATLQSTDRRGAIVRIDRFDPVEREWKDAPTLVLAIIAADPMDVAVRKAIELGVAAIVPVIAARTQGLPAGPRADKRLQHWRSIAIAACEQCGRNRIPPIAEPVDFETWLAACDANSTGTTVIAVRGGGVSLASVAAKTPPRTVVIGPEGGFTDGEVSLAVARGLTAVHLGPRTLRADTAVVAALATLAAINGDAS